jgi:hypothetical protein
LAAEEQGRVALVEDEIEFLKVRNTVPVHDRSAAMDAEHF